MLFQSCFRELRGSSTPLLLALLLQQQLFFFFRYRTAFIIHTEERRPHNIPRRPSRRHDSQFALATFDSFWSLAALPVARLIPFSFACCVLIDEDALLKKIKTIREPSLDFMKFFVRYAVNNVLSLALRTIVVVPAFDIFSLQGFGVSNTEFVAAAQCHVRVLFKYL